MRSLEQILAISKASASRDKFLSVAVQTPSGPVISPPLDYQIVHELPKISHLLPDAGLIAQPVVVGLVTKALVKVHGLCLYCRNFHSLFWRISVQV